MFRSIAIISSVVVLQSCGQTPAPHTRVPVTERAIRALVSDGVRYTTYRVDVETGGTFDHPSGTRITVQPHSLLDANTGQPLTGSVDLKYREFPDALTAFATGLPLDALPADSQLSRTYKDISEADARRYGLPLPPRRPADSPRFLQTGGMFELQAQTAGQNRAIAIAADKPIQVYLASQRSGTDYQQYVLDTVTRKWVLVNKTPQRVIPNPDFVKLERALAQPQPPKAIPDSTHSDDVYVTFNVQLAAEPELRKMTSLKWKAARGYAPKQADYEYPWRDIRFGGLVRHTDTELVYKFILEGDAKKLEVLVSPVLEGTEYSAKRQKREQVLRDFVSKIEERERALEKETRFNRLLRETNVATFGFHNCDHLYEPPQPVVVRAEFLSETGKPLNAHTVFAFYPLAQAYCSVQQGTMALSRSEPCIVLDTRLNALVITPDVAKQLQPTGLQQFTLKPVIPGTELPTLKQLADALGFQLLGKDRKS